MTDQRQSTRDQWTPQVRTLEPADPDRTGSASSTQDNTARTSADTDRPADDGTLYQSAAHDSAVDQPDLHEPVGDGTANEPEMDERTTEPPAADAEPLDAVDGSVPAGHAAPSNGGHDIEGHPADPPTAPVPTEDAASLAVARPGEMLPGDLPEEPGLALFDGETTERFRDRWQELQMRFVDDPHFAEGQAVALVDEVVTALRDAVDRQRSALHDWQAGQSVNADSADTEQMRVSVRRYRDFLDRLLGV